MGKFKSVRSITLIIISLLLLAIINMPYGYYTFLRIILFIYTLAFAYKSYNEKKFTWLFLFSTIAIMYNPIFVIHLNKTLRSYIDIATIIILFIELINDFKQRRDFIKLINGKKNNIKSSEENTLWNDVDKAFDEDPKYKTELDRRIKTGEIYKGRETKEGERPVCGTYIINMERVKIYLEFNKEK